jgi:sarcosine oxidase subunit gamma
MENGCVPNHPERQFAFKQLLTAADGELATDGDQSSLLIQPQPDCAIVQIIARKGQEERLAQRLSSMVGERFPAHPLAAVIANELVLAAVAPGEFMAFRQADDEPELIVELSAATGDAASNFDQSHGYGVFRVAGRHVYELLAKGSALDLNPLAFAAASASRTTIEGIPSIVVKLDETPTLLVAVTRSFARSFEDWLRDAVKALDRI